MGRVLVAGSINMDVVARAARFPAVGETVAGSQVHFFPGGKGANQAVAAAKLGAPTLLVGRRGDDAFGSALQAFLSAQGVDLAHVTVTAEAGTGIALITVCDGDNTIVVVPGANGLVAPSDVGAPAVQAADVLVSQFEIPVAAIAAFLARGRTAGARTVLNPAPVVDFDRALLRLVDVLVLNETELGALTGAAVDADETPARIIALARGLQCAKHQVVCVTLGRRGALALAGDETIAIAGRAVSAVDTTGAGDCFVGALAARLAAGATLGEALRYANVAASICVQRMGAGPSMPTGDEVAAAITTSG
ncbi:MAG TPA: ribokinase [Xanthobacteraceae bacterium]|nr:ribokinase [Xanthobacteraceae bacterium]